MTDERCTHTYTEAGRQEGRKTGRHEETDRGRPAFLWDLREIKSERIKREKVCVCVYGVCEGG